MAADVVVVGGGVIGLSIAYRLAAQGVGVTVIDRREVGREASWAGAGLIPAHVERVDVNPTAALRSWSATLYPEWSAALLDETGVDNGFRRTGGVDVALTDEDEAELTTMAGRWRAECVVFERLAPADLRTVEPALGPDVRAAVFLPDRAQIRNPWHLRALEAAVLRFGGRVLTGRPARGFDTLQGRVSAVRTDDGVIDCGAVVVAAGAWSSGLLDGLGVDAPTPPLKGQIVLMRTKIRMLRRIVEHRSNYLVPREDGRVLVGATQEDAGFDTTTHAEAERDLVRLARMLCPVLETADVERSWAGLRPGSIDSRPYLGPIPGYDNAFVATGHKRSGLQLSTGTAEAIADLILGRAPRLDLSAFRLGREPAAADREGFRS